MTMVARIYKPAKTAMQQGNAASREWVLEYAAEKPLGIEPLMGWTSSSDTRTQVRVSFPTREEAIAFATRQGLPFRVDEPQRIELRPKSYAENFKFGRVDSWTH
jgi:hypothetical protein